MARDRDFSFPCPGCGRRVEATLYVESYGCAGGYWHPAEGATWYLAEPVRCEDDEWLTGPHAGERIVGCGHVTDEDALRAACEDAIQAMLAEPMEDVL